jgi:hypothetical protein
MTINISIDKKHGVIKCDPQGGHLLAKPNQELVWSGKEGAEEFKLAFTDFKTGQAVWPFSQPATQPAQWPNPFIGILKGDDQKYYKYVVRVGTYDPLDPIIIVDRN